MPARLLAYGGTSFSERRRIGQWPAIPEGALRDSYRLTADTWCYGLGTLGQQPFVILRQKQNVENRGGYPFSLLLDPGDPVWQRFEWNGAALVSAILAHPAKDLLIQTPERCTVDALERIVNELVAAPRSGAASDEFRSLVLASCLQNEPIVAALAERPDPERMAAMLSALPICFRLAAGWLVNGGAAHGQALGANLVLDEQGIAPGDPGRACWAAWDSSITAEYETKPIWTWDVPVGLLCQALVLLRDLESATGPDETLLERVDSKPATTMVLDERIETAAMNLLTRGSDRFGPRGSARLLTSALRDKRKIDGARLDPQTLQDKLRQYGAPPKPVPRNIAIPRELRVALWIDYLQRVRTGARMELEKALDQLEPDLSDQERRQLVEPALATLRASDEKLADWERLQKFPEAWALLEPGLQSEAGRRAVPEPVRKPVRSRQPEPAPDLDAELRPLLEQVLFHKHVDSIERRVKELHDRFNGVRGRTELDEMIEQNCERAGDVFAERYEGKYMPLGDVMRFLSPAAQDRLMECLARYEGGNFATHITHAINVKPSWNAYSAALARYLLNHKDMSKKIAMHRSEEPKDFERKLRSALKR